MSKSWYNNLIEHIKKKNYFPNSNILFLSLFLFILFLVVEVTLRIWDLYKHIPMVDVPSHLFAGMAVACLAYWIYSLSPAKHKNLMAIIVTIIISIIWELLEIVQEELSPDPPYLADFFFWDGFWDIIVAVAGGAILLFIILPLLRKKTTFFKLPIIR